MDFVCNDDGGMEWMYEAHSAKYIRFNHNDEKNAIIAGKYLPDPVELWKKRCKLFGDVALNSKEAQPLKPQPATFELWEHWQGIQNAANHNEVRAAQAVSQ